MWNVLFRRSMSQHHIHHKMVFWKTRRNCDRKLRYYHKVVLYGNSVSSLVEGKSYVLKNLRLNSFRNVVYLNSTLSHITNSSAVTDQTIICKIKGVSSARLNCHCIQCNKKIDLPEDITASSLISRGECQAKMIKSNCRFTFSLTLVVNDVQEDANFSLFLPNEQCFKLKNIIKFPMVENEISTWDPWPSPDWICMMFHQKLFRQWWKYSENIPCIHVMIGLITNQQNSKTIS